MAGLHARGNGERTASHNPGQAGYVMRVGKRERAKLRQNRMLAAEIRRRASLAGPFVRIWTSSKLIARRVPIGRPSFKWGWDCRNAQSVLVRQRKTAGAH